ncbi:MAG: hypothetical protein LBH48_05845 [Bifidobacteriaceae bacterium]|nr:hypothetical protein [Bifidobacteriaceae bacterium]
MPWPRSRRGLIAAVVGAVLVILVVAGWLWFEASMQSQEHDRALAHSLAEAQRKDAELREVVKSLEPVMQRARVVREQTVEVLGPGARVTAELDDALQVAESMIESVASNSREVSDTLAAADAALVEDQNQLALIEPVRTNLTDAIVAAENAITGQLLGEAVSRLRMANAAMRAKMNEVTGILSTLTWNADRLTQSIAPPPPVVPPPGSPPPTDPEEELDDAEAEEAEAAREAVEAQIDQIKATIAALTAELTRAENLAGTEVDETDIDAVRMATDARRAETARLEDVVVRARGLHQDLLADAPTGEEATVDGGAGAAGGEVATGGEG